MTLAELATPPPGGYPWPETCACPAAVRYSCGHCWHGQCLDCGMCADAGCVCHCALGFTPGEPPAGGPAFWLGAHHPRWLATAA